MAYNQNATDTVYEFIVKKIRSNVWPPGSRIWSEAKLCQETGVSRTAVRQAVEKLSALSVLSKVHGSGTFVMSAQTSSISGLHFFQLEKQDILDLLEFRNYFEMGNVQMFIDRADEHDIDMLEKNYIAMCENSHNQELFFQLDNDFHNMIAKGSKNSYSIKVADTFFEVMASAQRGLYVNLGPQIGIEFHKIILEHIKNRDKELASLFMKRHIEANIKALLKK